jgi:anti-anti-sigma factor
MVQVVDAHAFVLQNDHEVLIIRLTVERMLGEQPIEELESQILQVMTETDQALVLDCQQLSGPVSSRFLALLLRIRKESVTRKIQLAICGLNGALDEVFHITRLNKLIPTYPASQPAVRDFGRFDKREQLRNDREREREIEAAYPWQRAKRRLLEGESPERGRLFLIGIIIVVSIGCLGWQVGTALLEQEHDKGQSIERMKELRDSQTPRHLAGDAGPSGKR